MSGHRCWSHLPALQLTHPVSPGSRAIPHWPLLAWNNPALLHLWENLCHLESKRVCMCLRVCSFPAPWGCGKDTPKALTPCSGGDHGHCTSAGDGAVGAQDALWQLCCQQAPPSDQQLGLYFHFSLPAGSTLGTALFRSLL